MSTVNGRAGDSVNGTPHPEFLGAYVLGLMDDDERAAVEVHLATCERCRDEVSELSGLTGMLATAPPAAVLADLAALDAADASPGRPGTDDLVLQRALREIRQESRRSRRMRVAGVAAGIVAVAGLAGYAGLALGQDDATGTPPAAVEQDARTRTATDSTTGVGMTAKIVPANTWTRLNVAVTGVEPGTLCKIIAVADDGRRDVAGSWIVSKPQPGTPRRGVDGSTSIAPDELAKVEIVDGEGKELVSVSA